MAKAFVWPWKDEAELLEVRSLLYPDKSEDEATRLKNQQLGVNIVNTWRLRQTRIPHSIQATADLIDAILHHEIGSNSASTIRAVYASALAKMVTSVCDLEQDSVEKRSMVEQARKIDMSVDWVHLRHAITHGQTPGLRTLEAAVREAVPWMWGHFWASLDGDATESEAEMKERLRGFLTAFRSQRRAELSVKQTKSADSQLVDQTSKLIFGVCKRSLMRMDFLIEVLIEDWYLIPDPRHTNVKFKGLLLVWDDLLRQLAQRMQYFHRKLVLAFVVKLGLARNDQITPAGYHIITDWLKHILDHSSWAASYPSAESFQVVQSDAIEACLLNSSQYVAPIVWHVLAKMSGPQADALRQLATATFADDDEQATTDIQVAPEADLHMPLSTRPKTGWSRPVDIWLPRPIGA